jgi:hypothetical protein
LSVYPAGVKQYYREELTAATGAITAINHPCVIKSISVSPRIKTSVNSFPVIILKIFDGTDSSMISRFGGSCGANIENTNMSILVPADGIKVNTSLGLEIEVIVSAGVSTANTTYCSISMMYQ